MNTSRFSVIRWVALIGAVFSLTFGAVSVSAGQPTFCKGKRVPEQYLGQVAFLPGSASVVRGGDLYVRLYNGLSRPIAFGHRYSEQRFADGAWTTVPPTPPPDGEEPIQPPASRTRLAATSASPCVGFSVSADHHPGKYRLIIEVFTDLQPGAKPRFRAAEFRVR